MTTLAFVVAIILALRWAGVAEPLTALVAAMLALLFAGLPPDKAALLVAGTVPRMLDYLSIGVVVATIAAALLGGMAADRERPRRPLGWSVLGDIRLSAIYLALCILVAGQFQNSIIQMFAASILYVFAAFAVALIAGIAAAGRQYFSVTRVLASLAVFFVLIVPAAAHVLLGLLTPTEAVCIIVLPLALLVRLAFDLASQQKLSGMLDDMIRGAVDGAWILLAFFGATLIVYAVRLQGPIASVGWFAAFSPTAFLTMYAMLTLLCCAFMGTTLGFLVAYAFFFAPFTESGIGLRSEVIALTALLCIFASLARPELGWKLTSGAAARVNAAGQLAGFAAAALLAMAVTFLIAPARF